MVRRNLHNIPADELTEDELGQTAIRVRVTYFANNGDVFSQVDGYTYADIQETGIPDMGDWNVPAPKSGKRTPAGAVGYLESFLQSDDYPISWRNTSASVIRIVAVDAAISSVIIPTDH